MTLRLRDIMTTDVFTVTPETSIRDALDLLGRRHVSGAPVVSGGKLLGVVTGTDLMTFVAALPGVPTARDAREAGEIGTEPALELDVEEEIEPPSAYFSELWDDAGADVAERITSVEGPEWSVLDEHDVSEVMTRAPLVTLSPEATAEEAADLMTRKAIHRVLVTEGGRLLGIVSALDITRAAADHKFVKRTYVFNRDEDFRNSE
jgi:CBS domain-containing protein